MELANSNDSRVSRQDRSNEDAFISQKLQLDTIDTKLSRAEKSGSSEEVKLLREKVSNIMKKLKI